MERRVDRETRITRRRNRKEEVEAGKILTQERRETK